MNWFDAIGALLHGCTSRCRRAPLKRCGERQRVSSEAAGEGQGHRSLTASGNVKQRQCGDTDLLLECATIRTEPDRRVRRPMSERPAQPAKTFAGFRHGAGHISQAGIAANAAYCAGFRAKLAHAEPGAVRQLSARAALYARPRPEMARQAPVRRRRPVGLNRFWRGPVLALLPSICRPACQIPCLSDSRHHSRGAFAPEVCGASPHIEGSGAPKGASNSHACEARRASCDRRARLPALPLRLFCPRDRASLGPVARTAVKRCSSQPPRSGRRAGTRGLPSAGLRNLPAGAAPCSAFKTPPEGAPRRAR